MSIIVEALKSDRLPHLRVATGFRWLVWCEPVEAWVVYSREPRQRKARQLIVTADEGEAMRHLLGEEETK